MAGPITWRNVGATVSGNGAASILNNADRSMARGFNALDQTLQRRQQTSNDNFENQQTNLAAEFQDRIQQAGSLEELEALRGNPQLEALRSQLTGAFRNQVRGSIDARETGIMEQTTARDGFGDTQQMREMRPQIAEWQRRALAGDQTALDEAAAAGVPREDFVRELFGDYTAGTTEKRAVNSDRRDGQRLAISQTASNRQGELHNLKLDEYRDREEAEQRANDLTARLNAAANASEGTTADRKAFEAEMLALYPDLSTEEVGAIRTDWDNRTDGRNQRSAADQSWVTGRQEAIDLEYDMANNPIAATVNAGGEATMQGVQDLITQSRKNGYLSEEGDDDVMEDTADKMFELSMNGIEDSQGRRVPVPLAAHAIALETSGDDLLEFDAKYTERIKEILSMPEFQRRVEEYTQAEDMKRRVELEADLRAARPKQ